MSLLGDLAGTKRKRNCYAAFSLTIKNLTLICICRDNSNAILLLIT